MAIVMPILAPVGSRGHAQVVGEPNAHSFDTVTDPRAIAMGESSVADAGDPASAFSSNPANLGFLSGWGFYSNYRSFDWVDEDWGVEDLYAWSLGVASPAPLGGMALALNRREHGRSSDLRVYDQTFYLAYAVSFGKVAAGCAVGFFNRFAHGGDFERESSYVPTFDLGVLYHADRGLSIGMALQNLSPEYEWRIASEGREDEYRTSLPLYLRTGFRYVLERPSTGGFPPLRFVAAGEYRWLYNPPDVPYGYGPGSGGFGLELTLEDWLSLRAGLVEYHEKGLHGRYGLGIHFSPAGELLPRKVRFDYAPVRVAPATVETARLLHSFGLRLSW